ncbi:hypothetical protein TNCV_2648801 [Trichonephila clavipes]|nr:hypothetical protein TNCV_2648801 [Trichonephila clavipes]
MDLDYHQRNRPLIPMVKPFLSSPAAILTHPNSSAPSASPIILSNAYEEVEEIEFDTEQAAAAVASRRYVRYGTHVAFEPYDGSRNRRSTSVGVVRGILSQFRSLSPPNEVSVQDPISKKICAGPHQAKDCTCILRIPSNAQIAVESTQLIGGNVRVFQKQKGSNHQNKGGNIKNNYTKTLQQKRVKGIKILHLRVMPSSQNLKHNNQLRSPQVTVQQT